MQMQCDKALIDYGVESNSKGVDIYLVPAGVPLPTTEHLANDNPIMIAEGKNAMGLFKHRVEVSPSVILAGKVGVKSNSSSFTPSSSSSSSSTIVPLSVPTMTNVIDAKSAAISSFSKTKSRGEDGSGLFKSLKKRKGFFLSSSSSRSTESSKLKSMPISLPNMKNSEGEVIPLNESTSVVNLSSDREKNPYDDEHSILNQMD